MRLEGQEIDGGEKCGPRLCSVSTDGPLGHQIRLDHRIAVRHNKGKIKTQVVSRQHVKSRRPADPGQLKHGAGKQGAGAEIILPLIPEQEADLKAYSFKGQSRPCLMSTVPAFVALCQCRITYSDFGQGRMVEIRNLILKTK